jgi:MATE family multidrug resistance protein
MTASILVGQAVGGEQIALAKKATRSCIILVVLYSLLMMMLFTVFQNIVLAPFVREGDTAQLEALKISGYMLYFISAYLIFDAFSIVYSSALRGAGDTKFPMWTMTVVGLCFFALPCIILYHLDCPWWSLWIAFDLEILLLGTIFALRCRQGKWTRMRVIEVAAAPGDENL